MHRDGEGADGDADAGVPQSNANAHLRHHLMYYLRAIFSDGAGAAGGSLSGSSTAGGWKQPQQAPHACTFSISHYGILDWSRDGSGVHQWRPGARSGDVMRALAAGAAGVRVAGEAFSTCQGFIEGGLTAVDLALDSMGLRGSDGLTGANA